MNMKQSNNRQGPVVIVSKDIVYAFPFGIAYLAGYLRAKGEDVRVLFRPENPDFYPDFARKIAALNPLAVAFGSLYPDLYPVRDIIRLLDAGGRSFPAIIGGQMVSPTPEFAVRVTGADYGVIGEGEIILHNLVVALRNNGNPAEVKGLVVRDGDATLLTGPGEFIEDLADLPPIPYDLFPAEKWLDIGRFYARAPQPHWRYNDRVVSIHGGRGCPYTCNFCYHSNRARYRKIPDMMAEADEMLARYDANLLYFGDDLVLASPKRARELTEAITRLSRPVEYSVSCRFDILSRIDDDLLREMRRTGCRIMGLGIESGSQRILDVMHKRITVEQIREGLRRLKNVRILPTVSIMVGQLSETREDVEESMALMLDAVRENIYVQFAFTITTPFPGTELYQLAIDQGMLRDHDDFFKRFDPDRQIGELTVNFSAMGDDEVRAQRKRLEDAFRRESELMKGAAAMRVERLRKILGKIDYELRRRFFPELKATGLSRLLLWPYFAAYDLLQILLDRLRLRLMGLRDSI